MVKPFSAGRQEWNYVCYCVNVVAVVENDVVLFNDM